MVGKGCIGGVGEERYVVDSLGPSGKKKRRGCYCNGRVIEVDAEVIVDGSLLIFLEIINR